MTDAQPYDVMTAAAVQVLRGGPLPISELVERLDADGLLEYLREDGFEDHELDDAVTDDLDPDAIWVVGSTDLAVLSSQMTDGLVLTHRLTDIEAASGAIWEQPDLVGLDLEPGDELVLDSGGVLTVRFSELAEDEMNTLMSGPDGWLDAFAPGDLIAFTRKETSVSVRRVDDVGNGEREVELLRAGADHWIAPNSREDAFPIVMDALASDLGAFRTPVRPLGELLEAAGLERRGGPYARRGEVLLSPGQRRARSVATADDIDWLADEWDFEECCVAAFAVAGQAFASLPLTHDGRGPSTETDFSLDARAAAEALAHAAVAPALAEFVLQEYKFEADLLTAFAEAVIAGVPAARAAPARLLWALAADRRGEGVAAEAALRQALADDPDYGPAAIELADYAIDRGELGRALALLRHPDVSVAAKSIEQVEKLRDVLEEPFRGVGRNDPCPCRSGRKFKVCCQRDPKMSTDDRIALVQYKLAKFAARVDNRPRITGIATSVFDENDDELTLESLAEVITDPWINDLAVMEGGIAADYLASRGDLLPPDERRLLEALIAEPRRLWEVLIHVPGSSLTVQDVASGKIIGVVDDTGDDFTPGELYLLRTASVADGNRIVGVPVEVEAEERESLRAVLAEGPDADALARWYGRAM